MNLLQLLLSALLSKKALEAISKKTGLSSALVKKLVLAAVPILIRYMTSNAQSQSGALSLAGALAQHNNNKSIAEQIDEVDEVDGGKIIGHILGKDQDQIVNGLAQDAGVKVADVTKTLGSIAPALLAGLSAAALLSAKKPQQQVVQQPQAVDLASLLQTFGGQDVKPSSTADILGSLLNVATQQQQVQQPQSGLGNLLGTLMAAQQMQQQPIQQQQAAFDGSDLLNILGTIMANGR